MRVVADESRLEKADQWRWHRGPELYRSRLCARESWCVWRCVWRVMWSAQEQYMTQIFHFLTTRRCCWSPWDFVTCAVARLSLAKVHIGCCTSSGSWDAIESAGKFALTYLSACRTNTGRTSDRLRMLGGVLFGDKAHASVEATTMASKSLESTEQ